MNMKRLLSLTLALLMVLGSVLPVMAATPPDTNDLYIHKVMYNNGVELDPIQNTGLEVETAGYEPYDRTLHGDVGFTLYALDAAQVEAASVGMSEASAPQTIADNFAASIATGNLLYGGSVVGEEVQVNDSGLALFPNVPSNANQVYVIVETTSPATVTNAAAPMLIQLPITNAAGDDYLTDVHLYPKNEITPFTFDLVKYQMLNGENVATVLPGAQFLLYQGTEGGSGVLVGDGTPIVTNENGTITVEGLTAGETYYFVEIEAANLVDNTAVATADQVAREDVGTLLVSRYMMDTPENRLGFIYGADGNVTFPENSLLAEGQQVINYERPEIAKEVVGAEEGVVPSYGINDIIPFAITLTVPHDIATYDSYSFEDTPSTGLVINTDSISIEGLTLGTDYTVTPNAETGSYVLDFVVNGAFSDTFLALANSDVVVNYEAQLNYLVEADQVVGNDVLLTYNNGAEDRYDNSHADVTTYGINFYKVNDGLWETGIAQTALEGAEFVVRRTVDGAEEFLAIDTDTSVRSWVATQEEAYVFTSDNEGAIVVSGLQEGNYTLVEIKAPEGYQLPIGEAAETDFTVNADSFTAEAITIENSRMPGMPVTGLEKSVMVFGGLLTVLVLAVVVNRKRQTSNN